MVNIKKRVEKEIDNLLEQGAALIEELKKSNGGTFTREYQGWYSRTMLIVKQLLPERLEEFLELYEGNISKYLRGNFYSSQTEEVRNFAGRHFVQQYLLLESTKSCVGDTLYNIQGLLQAEILDSEVEASFELLKAGHLRASGTLAGVVLERHLSKICESKKTTSKKKSPTLADWNDLLKDAKVYDIPTWRGIQHLADIRNLCAHAKDREPTKDEVEELIRGVERITKTIF